MGFQMNRALLSTTERNNICKVYVNTMLEVAKTKVDDDFPDYGVLSDENELLTDLIEINRKGFRGVVVTALTGMHLDDQYDPLNDFYGCNPRAIFEKGIWYALQDNDIPCGLSDPLNVAKNIQQLDEAWATGKRPQSAALAAVNFLRMVVSADETKRSKLIDYFFYRLLAYAKEISNFNVVNIEPSSVSRQAIGSRLIEFTLAYPESGNSPQLLVYQLLKCVYERSDIQVKGGDGSVFGTNTTSNKPADLWTQIDGVEINLYEVTVKKVDKKRLDDNLSSLRSTGHLDKTVTFICRLPEDVSELEIKGGNYSYKGKCYDFVDYQSFCTTLFALLSDIELRSVVQSVREAVQDKNVPMETKAGWNKFFTPEA